MSTTPDPGNLLYDAVEEAVAQDWPAEKILAEVENAIQSLEAENAQL